MDNEPKDNKPTENPVDTTPNTPPETPPEPVSAPDALPPSDTAPIIPTATMPTEPIITQPKKSKKPLIITLIVLVVIAIGVSIWLYMINQPQFMLDQATQQLGQQKNFASKVTIQTGTGDTAKTIYGDMSVRGDDSNKDNGELVAGVGADNTRVGLTARLAEGNLFWKLDGLENLGRLLESLSLGTEQSVEESGFKSTLDTLNNNWFFATKEELADFAKSTGQDSVTGNVKPEEIKTVANIYNQHRFIKADKQYGDETIDGENTAHFDVKIDVNEYVAFLQGVKNANLQTFKVTDQDIEDAKKEVEKSQDTRVDVWVTRFSNKLKQLRASTTKQGEEGSITLTLPANPPTSEKIEKPTDARSLGEFMTTLFGMSSLQTQESELTEEEQQLLNQMQ